MVSLDDAVAAADTFLDPALSPQNNHDVNGQNLIGLLAASLPAFQDDTEESLRDRVVRKALRLLLDLHHAVLPEPHQLQAIGAAPLSSLYEAKYTHTIYGLVDLISLEGILPFLSPGVGITRDRRATPPAAGNAEAKSVVDHPKDKHLLSEVTEELCSILENAESAFAPMIRERNVVDVICGLEELAFAPDSEEDERSKHRKLLRRLINSIPTVILLPLFTDLLKPTTPAWLRPHLSTSLSLLPLRPHGVRHIIDFIASSMPATLPSSSGDDSLQPSQGPPLSPEALQHVSRLLASVPSFMTPDVYFAQLAPQLFDLLDGNDGPEMSKAAGYIIGSGILGRRVSGAPGTIGWNLFARPLLQAIDPAQGEHDGAQPGYKMKPSLETTITSGRELKLAVHRLSALILSHPSPGLVKRLLGPLMLPIWGMMNCERSKNSMGTLWDEGRLLLETFIKYCASERQLSHLAENLLWDGPSEWNFASGSGGGVELRKREKDLMQAQNMIELVSQVDQRTDAFVKLLQSSQVNDGTIGAIFLDITKRWLIPEPNVGEKKPSLITSNDDLSDPLNPLSVLVNAKLVQAMLEHTKDKIAASPARIFQLVTQIVDQYVETDRVQKKTTRSTQKATYAGLGGIVKEGKSDGQRSTPGLSDEASDLVSIALSLLSTIVSAPDFKPNEEAAARLVTTRTSLESMLASVPQLPPSLSLATQNSMSLIELYTKTAAVPSTTRNFNKTTRLRNDRLGEDHAAHASALQYLSSDQPPIRAEGLSIVSSLISRNSPAIDTPSTTILLLTILAENDIDDFVSMNATKTLVVLAGRDPRMVVKMLLQRYVDPAESSSLEERLRIGEALIGVSDALASDKNSTAELTRGIAEAVMSVAGRRGQRPKQAEERRKTAALEAARREEAEQAWGGDVPTLPSFNPTTGKFSDDDDDDTTDPRTAADDAILHAIVDGWAGSGLEEDVRIRASALSVLAHVLGAALDAIGPALAAAALELTLSVLALETGDAKAILRRAAALVVMALLRALDAARERGERVGFGLAGRKLDEVVRALRYVQEGDEDGLVKGHVGVVLESLEAWRAKTLFGLHGEGSEEMTPRFGLGGGRLAGLSVDPGASERARPRIEEVE